MEVWQVVMITDVRNYLNPEENYTRDTDLGLFANLKLADGFIENHLSNQVAAEMNNANGVWLSAYPKDDDFSLDGTSCFRKSLLIEDRPSGDFIRLDYFVKRIVVKES